MADTGCIDSFVERRASCLYAIVYEHPVYWQKIEEETKGSGDIERSTCLFIDSEKAREHTEEEMIKVENIRGKLF